MLGNSKGLKMLSQFRRHSIIREIGHNGYPEGFSVILQLVGCNLDFVRNLTTTQLAEAFKKYLGMSKLIFYLLIEIKETTSTTWDIIKDFLCGIYQDVKWNMLHEFYLKIEDMSSDTLIQEFKDKEIDDSIVIPDNIIMLPGGNYPYHTRIVRSAISRYMRNRGLVLPALTKFLYCATMEILCGYKKCNLLLPEEIPSILYKHIYTE